MRIAISNIAWDVSDDESVAQLLHKYGIDAIDVAPGKYFPNPESVHSEQISRVRNWWSDRGIATTGMQALLFGTSGLNLFGSDESREAMLLHLNHICRIASELGASKMVFGSPKNRDRTGRSDEKTYEIATEFFRKLGDIAGKHGVVICLEPNPTRYGANFMVNSTETANIVLAVSHSAIRMQLDTGALTINGECPETIIRKYAALIGHIHASEPDLVLLGDGKTDHSRIAKIIGSLLPEQIISIEMLPSATIPNIVSLERAIILAIHHYRENYGAVV